MNTCENCGKSFDGENCPHCSAENSNGVCPRCGAVLSATAKFCSECGHNIAGGDCAKHKPDYFWIKLAPTALFIVFALLLFGVYAESLISGVVSVNVYLLCDATIVNDAGLSTISILLIIFAVLTLIAAVVIAALKFLAYKQGKPINNKTDWISFACYILYFILGLVISIIIADNEVMFVGACPVWLIIMPIIFLGLLGAIHAYVKFNATVSQVSVAAPAAESTPSIQEKEEKAESKKEKRKKEKTESNGTTRPKRGKSLLPAILFLVFAVVMWILYSLPTIRYIRFEDNNYTIYTTDIYGFNFIPYDDATNMFINIFQYALVGYLAVVTVAAVALLVYGILHVKKGDDAIVKVCGKSLLTILVLSAVHFVIALALFLFTMFGGSLTGDVTYEAGCVVLVAVPAVCVIGAIIAMIKSKKNRNKKAPDNLE